MEEKITAWIARDSHLHDNALNLYFYKPHKCEYTCTWQLSSIKSNSKKEYRELQTDSFTQVKWEDEEPTEVELTIKIKE